GARLHGGRWNSPGYDVLYASSTLALACLEVLVHIRDLDLIPTDYTMSEIQVPDKLISPCPWQWDPVNEFDPVRNEFHSRRWGDKWLRWNMTYKGPTLEWRELGPFTFPWVGIEFSFPWVGIDKSRRPVLAVPSIIIPREMNYLISP